MNRGIQDALATGADLLFILNNDTVIAPDVLARLVSLAQVRPDVGMLACELRALETPNRTLRTVVGFDWVRGCTRTLRPGEKRKAPIEADLVSACALLVRREVVEQVGLMDERYFIYFEDLDWALRARRAGFKCLVVPDALVWHGDSATTMGDRRAPRPMFYYYYMRNNIHFVQEHGSLLARVMFLPACAFGTVWWFARVVAGGLVARKRNVRIRLRAIAAGFVHGWSQRWGAFPAVHPGSDPALSSRGDS
jgi:GT2 family glycosyltransferase